VPLPRDRRYREITVRTVCLARGICARPHLDVSLCSARSPAPRSNGSFN
jgi:hypothetical protein